MAGAAIWNLRTSAPSRPAAMFELPLPPNAELPVLNDPAVAVSPDGVHIVFVARRGGIRQLYHRRMNELTAHPLPGTEGGRGLFFSPDSQWVGFTANSKLFKVSLSGGVVVPLADASTRGASWTPSGTIVFTEHIRSGLLEISADGGEAKELTRLDSKTNEASHRWPQVLPGGESVLFTLSTHDTETWDDAQIVVQSIGSGERRVVVEAASYGRYVSTGHVVYARSGKLFAVRFDLDRLEVKSTGVPVLENVAQFPSSGSPQISLSDLGDLIYVSGGVRTNSLVWVDRNGNEESLSVRAGAYSDPRLSPDGLDVAVVDQGPDNEVWIHGISRGTMTRLTFEANNNAPFWSPDGTGIVFSSWGVQESSPLVLAQADGSREVEELLTTELTAVVTSWSSDGHMLAGSLLGRSSDIWFLELDGERKLQYFLRTPFAEGSPSFSPDSRWLAYESNETGRYEIYVQPFPGPGRKLQISTEGGMAPKWRRDAGEIFFRNGDKIMAVDITTTPTFTPGKSKLLFEGKYEGDWDVSADGRRFLMIKGNDEGQRRLVVVQGWSRELERLVPTDN